MCAALLILAAAGLPGPAPAGERIVAGLSQDMVSITTTFTGSRILVFGAVQRDAPPPPGDMQVIVTVEGPSGPVTIRRKSRRWGIWVNTAAATVTRAPNFYAIAASAPLARALSDTDNLRYQITVPRAIRAVGVATAVPDAPDFLAALVRLRAGEGRYRIDEDTVGIVEDTLFRADFDLPADLVEGDYRVRMFLTRDSRVVDLHEEAIRVTKAGFERWINALSRERPLVYGLLALALAVGAGWGASAAFSVRRR